MTAMLSFGALLKQLRKRAGMTQRDLAAALNYSDSLISSLESTQRLLDLHAVINYFIPALGLHDDPTTAALLVERTAAALGERAPLPSRSARLHTAGYAQNRMGFQTRCRAHPTSSLAVTKSCSVCATACAATAGGR